MYACEFTLLKECTESFGWQALNSQTVGITIAVMAVLFTTVVFIVYVIYKIQQKKRKKSPNRSMHAKVATSYMAINTNHEASPEEPPAVNEA